MMIGVAFFYFFIHSCISMLDFFFRFKIITPDPTHPDQLNFPSKSVHDLGNKYPVIKVNLSGGVYYIYSVYFCHRISKCRSVLFVHFVMHLILPLTSRSVRLATTQYKHTQQSLNGFFLTMKRTMKILRHLVSYVVRVGTCTKFGGVCVYPCQAIAVFKYFYLLQGVLKDMVMGEFALLLGFKLPKLAIRNQPKQIHIAKWKNISQFTLL